MRNPKRLNKTYAIICFLHKKYFPDLRIMQLIPLFTNWHLKTYNSDGYYIEEDLFIERFYKFCEEVRPC